jgi:hypothetical protein
MVLMSARSGEARNLRKDGGEARNLRKDGSEEDGDGPHGGEDLKEHLRRPRRA